MYTSWTGFLCKWQSNAATPMIPPQSLARASRGVPSKHIRSEPVYFRTSPPRPFYVGVLGGRESPAARG
jgi:hypothetical protein